MAAVKTPDRGLIINYYREAIGVFASAGLSRETRSWFSGVAEANICVRLRLSSEAGG